MLWKVWIFRIQFSQMMFHIQVFEEIVKFRLNSCVTKKYAVNVCRLKKCNCF